MLKCAQLLTSHLEKVRPFLRKYCSQAGSLPRVDQLKTIYVPRLFDLHLRELLRDKHISITADETTDIRDHSILNVIASVHGQPYLIGVTKMEACNHSTFSQAIFKVVSNAGIDFDSVVAVVTDGAAYCVKAYREVLSPVFPKSTHILCLAHVVNLGAEIFRHYVDFSHTSDPIAMIKWEI